MDHAILLAALLAAESPPTVDLSIFSPASPAAESIVSLALLTVAISIAIFFLVEGILVYCVWQFRDRAARGSGGHEPAQVYGSQPIEIAWTAAPAMIVFFLVLVTARSLWEINPPAPAPKSDDHALFVTVVGRQWWWEYQYESYDGKKLRFITANELHMPVSDENVSRPAYLKLESADVCHSFWTPRLNGKMDLIPGRTNELVLETREAGLHLGQCAEYCGTQHANMLLRVVVESPEKFEAWLAKQEPPAVGSLAALEHGDARPAGAIRLVADEKPRADEKPAEAVDAGQAAGEDAEVREGRELFLAQSCVNCHRVRGTKANGHYAPDLTHLMSRDTLAAGEIPNTAENLALWVRDPQKIKPGCLMPAFKLDDRTEKKIVRYLLSLE